MILIQFPKEKPKLKKSTGKEFIFCSIRKKWLIFTPEEWVRQNLILYLTLVKHYPPSLISVEKQIMVNQQKKRIDIAVYKNNIPFLLIECKNMNVPLQESALSQSLAYFSSWNAEFLLVSNGVQTKGFSKNGLDFTPIISLPDWE